MSKPKTVPECIHHWAHQVEHKGYVAAKCGSVRYDGPTLYSYAEPIARFMDNNVVLISNVHFSNTTGKHQHLARRAVHHGWTIVRCSHPEGTHEDNQRVFKHHAMNALEELAKHPRRKKSCMDRFNVVNSQYVHYSLSLSLNWPDLVPEEMRVEAELAAKIAAERDEANRIARAAQIAREAEEEKADLARWRAGEDVRRHFHATALRIVDDEIQTTRGARVPVEVAPALWRLACRQRGEGLALNLGNRYPVSHYNLDSIGPDGSLHIGCHHIPFFELELIAEQLGYEGYIYPTTLIPTQENHHEHARA